jgi:hypothetical protein
MGDLREEQTDYMAPWTKRARLILGVGFPGQFGNQEAGNIVAYLPEYGELTSTWFLFVVFLFHKPAVWQIYGRKPSLFDVFRLLAMGRQ